MLKESFFQRFDASFQFFMLKRFLNELDYSLSRSDADGFSFAVQVLYEGLGCLRYVDLQAIQRPVDNLVPLLFKLSTEVFILEPFVQGTLIESCAPACLFSRSGCQ